MRSELTCAVSTVVCCSVHFQCTLFEKLSQTMDGGKFFGCGLGRSTHRNVKRIALWIRKIFWSTTLINSCCSESKKDDCVRAVLTDQILYLACSVVEAVFFLESGRAR